MSSAAEADLRQRLAEAEETLRAIREGEIDALLVRGAESDEVFHLGGGGDSYRAFMEAMDLGAAAIDAEGGLIYANASLAALLGRPFEELQRDGLKNAMGAAAGLVSDLTAKAAAGRHSAQVVLGPEERRRHVVVTAARLPLSFGDGVALTFTDITERVEAAAMDEAERLGRAIMASANEAVVVCDRRGVITHANAAAQELLETSPVGQRFDEAFALSFAPGAGVMEAGDVPAVALAGSSLRGLEAAVLSKARVEDLLISAAPLRQAGGAIGGCVITLVDLSERKALEKRQALVLRELDHRIKNMLTLVLSISARTLSTSESMAEFNERFTNRISALAATQNLLAERAGAGLVVQDLLQMEVEPYLGPQSGRLALSGLETPVSREAATAIGLVFHELVTNAVKYGALSNEAGQVEVRGRRTPLGLEIVWREVGGPAVTPPQHRGFGHTVIARGLGHSAGAPTRLEFPPQGVVCVMVISDRDLA